MSEIWRLKYKGSSLKIKKGNTKETSFLVMPYGTIDTIKVNVVENPNNLKVSITPERVKLDGSNPIEVKVKIEIPDEIKYKPLWLLKLKFEGFEKNDYAYIGILPLDENSHKVTIREAKEDDSSYAVGAPSHLKFSNRHYLIYRWRNGNIKRGNHLEIAESTNGLDYKTVKTFIKEDYEYASFEQASFVKNVEDKIILLYCADTGGLWKIFSIESDNVNELELPGKAIIERGKDPASFYDPSINGYVIIYSNGNNVGHDLTVLASKDFKSMEIKANSLVYTQFIKQGNTWARTHIHAGAITKVDGYYVLFYDALSRKPNCFGSGWLGIAISKDLRRWIDLTPKNPIWQGNGIDRTFRYVDIYCDNSCYILYAEEEVSIKGRKDLIAYHVS